MKLSLVVPCYNEESNVRAFHDAALAVFSAEDYDFEMVFVNDGSRDNTLTELKKLHSEARANIKVVSFSRNFGKEAAMLAGLKEAEGDYTCLIDADLQQRPEVTAAMVKMLDGDPNLDCVAAFQDVRSESGSLAFFKKNFYKLINSISDVDFIQGASDFRTFKTNVRDALLNMGDYQRFTKGLFSFVGFNTLFIPYQAQQRQNGESKWSFFKLFNYALDGIESFSTVPLRLASLSGLGLLFLAFLTLIISFVRLLIPGGGPLATSWITLLIFLVGGLQLLCTGILGEYLAKAYMQGKGRPIYIVREVLQTKQNGGKNNDSE